MADPDDLHVCLKCHDQIVGLDNYIEHRQFKCRGKPQEDEENTPDAETGDRGNADAEEPSDITGGENLPSKASESNDVIAKETETGLPPSPGEVDNGVPASKTDTGIHQQKRKRGRPRKIDQRGEACISAGTRSGHLLKMKRHPAASPKSPASPEEKETKSGRPTRRRLQVPARYNMEDDIEESIDSDYEVASRKSRPPKARKSRNSKLVLTEEEKAAVAEYKVGKHYRCSPCSIRSTNLHALLKHVKTIKHLESVGSRNPDAKFQCLTCSLVFFTEQGLTRHSLRHEQQCRCSKCGSLFDSRRELQVHHKAEHGQKAKRGQSGNLQACETCGKVLSRGYMKIHLRIHTGEKPFSCDICPFKTNQQGDLKMHQKRHYGIKDHKCSLCNFVTVKASILKNHMKLHTKRERTEACHLCPQKFYNQGLLKSHIHLRHEPSRVHLCNFLDCTYKFKCKIDLVTHMRRHTNEKPFLCTVCGYAGSTKQALARHSRKHTGAKPFKCDHPGCPYRGRVSTHLTRHKRLHTGAKPYKCPYCSYRANTHENVRKHIRNTKKHAGLSVYMCKLCSDMQTDVYQDLVDHMRKLHTKDYVTFDQVSHQMGLLADKEEVPDVPETAEASKDTLPTKLSEELQLAIESDKASQDLLTTEDDRLEVEMQAASAGASSVSRAAVTTKQEVGHSLQIAPAGAQVDSPSADVKEDLCKEYIICRVIQDGGQQPHPRQGVGNENREGSETMGQDAEEMQEIQMVTVEGQTEALEMILRQAVSNGSAGHQDYIIL